MKINQAARPGTFALGRVLVLLPLAALARAAMCQGDPLPGTQALTMQGDLAAQMVSGIDRFLMNQTAASVGHRPATGSPPRLAKMLGVVDPRIPFDAFELVATTKSPALIAHGVGFALIAPRPFMVERGHGDGVGKDEWVAYEYAKVRRLYFQLKIPDRTTIEFFNGPHTIHGVGTFEFLHKQLHWTEPAASP